MREIEDRVRELAHAAGEALAKLYEETPEEDHAALTFGILTAALADHIDRRGLENTARASLSALAGADMQRLALAAADPAGSA